MELKEFVKKVLIELVNGVEEADADSSRHMTLSRSDDNRNRSVEFDIAVTVDKKDEVEGRAGVRVLQFVEGGGNISQETSNSTITRIKFGVNVDAVTKEKAQQISQQFHSHQPPQRYV